MKVKGKIIGFFLGIFICGNIITSVLLLLLAHILFDQGNKRIEDDEENDSIVDDINEIQSKNLLRSILVLCYNLISLKKNILISEIDQIKSILQSEFGVKSAELIEVNKIIKDLSSLDTVINNSGGIKIINSYCLYDEKLKIVNLLFKTAISDAEVNEKELDYLSNIALLLLIKSNDYESIKNQYVYTEKRCYEVLGVTEKSTDSEIKSAYRKLVITHHPDKARDGFDKDKFQRIVKAYEDIKKVRNI